MPRATLGSAALALLVAVGAAGSAAAQDRVAWAPAGGAAPGAPGAQAALQARAEGAAPPVAGLGMNPFTLPKPLIIPGTTFHVEAADQGDAALDPAHDRVALSLTYEGRDARGRAVHGAAHLPVRAARTADGRLALEARMPALAELPGIDAQTRWGGVLHPYHALLVAQVEREGRPGTLVELPVRLPSVAWAYVWGLVVVAGALLGFALLGRYPGPGEAEGGRSWRRRLLSPLDLITTPAGGYSLSLAQVLVWTAVTLFGLVYVYWLTYDFLAITPQVLVLLGIGGGTALATKVLNDDSAVPGYMALAGQPRRRPRLRDLVWSAGRPDIFKFQMLVFTLLTAYIVVVEIAKNYAFPAIPENLVALMGVSSAVYVGNKVVQRREAEPAREELRAAAQAVAASPDPAAASGDAEKLRALLDRLYK